MKQQTTRSAGAARMTDAELSKKLGRYQTMAAVCTPIGAASAVLGVILFFAVPNAALRAILVAVLFSGGVCCAVFLGGGAQKKAQALLQAQLGDFFRAELERAFGPALDAPDMCIDTPFMQALSPAEKPWETCAAENCRAGMYRGVRFCAANVQLNHTYKKGNGHDGYETCTEAVFRGLVLRCETRVPAPAAICGCVSSVSPFCVTAEPEPDARSLLTPQFTALLETLSRNLEGKIAGFAWDGSVFSLVLETNYAFACVAGRTDLRDLAAVRRSYTNSLHALQEFLDLLLQDTALFAAD